MPVMTNTEPSVPNDPIARLWQIARAWLIAAMHAFGDPVAVAATFSPFARQALARRLRALETFALKLLLVEAARLAPPGRQRAAASTVAARRADIAGGKPAPQPDPARPETWRVRFELRIPGDTPVAPHTSAAPESQQRSAPRAPAVRDPARERAKAEKLARRLEALRRVVADPLSRARRLKRKLMALGARAYDAAMRIAVRRPPHHELNPIIHARAEFAACFAATALVAPPTADSS
jgi:hypothetical protein